MAITRGYLTLAEYKLYKDITSSDTNDDVILENIIESASRFIDNYTGQFFYKSTGATKYFTALDPNVLFIDNLYGITTLKTDENCDGTYEITWNTGQNTGDFYLMPFNASEDGLAYNRIEVNPEGDYVFPPNIKGVQIAGDWGYSAVPDAIRQACYEIVNSYHGHRSGQNLTGEAQITAAGVVITPDSIPASAREILNAYRRPY